MAKDNPEDQTAPIYNPDGTIFGYTTPEKAAEIEAAFGPNPNAPPPPPPPSSSTGETLRIFNPVTGEYETHNTADYEARYWRPGGGNVIWGNVDGQTTLVRTDVEGWDSTGAVNHTPDSSQWTYGYVPPPSHEPPSVGGMAPDGGQYYGDPADSGNTGNLEDQPWYDDYVKDREDWEDNGAGFPEQPPSNVPQPEGDGSFDPWTPSASGSRPSWNWDYFKPKAPGDSGWGGYDADYGVFERYQPGQDSPWGMPDVMGGNQEFYQQQFNNLLRDEQDYRTRQRAAQLRAQEAAENPSENINFDDMWASMGITPVQAAGSDAQGNPTAWNWNSALGDVSGKTNAQILASAQNLLSKADYDKLLEGYANDDKWQTSTYWQSFDNPEALKEAWIANQGPLSPEWQTPNMNLFDVLFTNSQYTTPAGGGPSAAPGYALPIS